MKRITYLLFFFSISTFSFSQLLSLDGSKLFFKNGENYIAWDVKTGEQLEVISATDHPYNLYCSDNIWQWNSADPAEPEKGEKPFIAFTDEGSGKKYSTAFELDKYKPYVQHINFLERKLYVLFVAEKESDRKKYLPVIYSFDFETMTPEFVTEANDDYTSHLAVSHGIVALEYDNVYEVKDKKLVPVNSEGGVCIGVTDSLIAFYRYYADYAWSYNLNKSNGWEKVYHTYDRDAELEADQVVIEVRNRRTGQIFSEIIKPLAPPGGGDTAHYYNFTTFSPDLLTYYECEPDVTDPKKATWAIARNTLTHEVLMKYGSPSAFKADSADMQKKSYRRWLLTTRKEYQDSLDKIQLPYSIYSRSATINGMPREDFGVKYFEEYRKRLVGDYERQGWSLLTTITGDEYVKDLKGRYLFNKPNWIYGVLAIITDDPTESDYMLYFKDVNKPEGLVADFDYLVTEGRNISDTTLPGVITGFQKFNSKYTFDAFIYIDNFQKANKFSILIFAIPEQDFFRGTWDNVWIENTGPIITGKGSENDSIREAQAKLKKEMEREKARAEQAAVEEHYCDACGGTGMIYPESVNCTHCWGKGYVKCSSCTGGYIYKSDGKGGRKSEYCYRCHGSGQTYCFSCGGKGYTSQGGSSVCTKCNGSGLKE
jgi:hypothetical protein